MKVELVIMDVVKGTSTNAEAYPLFISMDKIISNGDHIVLSFKNCTPPSSSFLNSSLGELFDKYGFSKMTGNLSIKDYTPALAGLIKNYISNLSSLV